VKTHKDVEDEIPEWFGDTYCKVCGYPLLDGECAVEVMDFHYSAPCVDFTRDGVAIFLREAMESVPDIMDFCEITKVAMFTKQTGIDSHVKRLMLRFKPNKELRSFIQQTQALCQ